MISQKISFYLIVALLLASTYSQISPPSSFKQSKTQSSLKSQSKPVSSSNTNQSGGGQIKVIDQYTSSDSQYYHSTQNYQGANANENQKIFDEAINKTFTQIDGADKHKNNQEQQKKVRGNLSQQTPNKQQKETKSTEDQQKDKTKDDQQKEYPSLNGIKTRYLEPVMVP